MMIPNALGYCKNSYQLSPPDATRRPQSDLPVNRLASARKPSMLSTIQVANGFSAYGFDRSATLGSHATPADVAVIAKANRMTPATRVCCVGVNRSGIRAGHDDNAVRCRVASTITTPDSCLGNCPAS